MIKLTPPILSIQKQMTCNRPVRDGRFNISLETKGKRKKIHCYGHGGAGWTTVFGSVARAIEFLDKGEKRPIRVIGAGCIGLAMAAQLARKGYNVAGITTEELYNIPSWRAGGYFGLVSVRNDPEEQENCVLLGLETFKVYQSIEKGKHPYLKQSCLRQLPTYCPKGTETGLEDLAARKLISMPEEVSIDFGNGVRHHNFLKYTTYYVDTAEVMKQLTAEVKRLGIPIEIYKVASFDEIKEEIIFDCSGLGGRDLNYDMKTKPVRGHLLLLDEKAGDGHMDYMIYATVSQNEKKECIYLFPKTLAVCGENEEISCRGVLGGTFVAGTETMNSEEIAALDRQEFKKLLERASLFFHGTQLPAETLALQCSLV